MTIPITNIGLASTIIHEATITASVKNALASLIFLLFKVDKYLYVTRKLAPLIIDELSTNNTPIKPISVLPIAVYLVLDENGVIMAQPGIKSLAFRSIDQKTPSSDIYRLNKVF